MSQLRKDPLLDRWVIIATERANRPNQFDAHDGLPGGGPCPFCAGNEDMTPPEIMAYRPQPPEKSGWSLRVVPNKFPALSAAHDFEPDTDGIYDSLNGFGAHEVIIETPRHESNMAHLAAGEFENAITAYQERILALKRESRLRHVLIFKNQGLAAGATIEHVHSQLVALPLVPRQVADELSVASQYYQRCERCLYCALVAEEFKQQRRVVSNGATMLAVCPFASRFPFETWVLPKRHGARFEHASEHERAELAQMLKQILLRLNRGLGNLSFNWMIHSMPFHEPGHEHYHWHVEIIPKLTQVGGFEWGSGFHINPVSPEAAALSLRVDQF
jgi:UDPglucose--hexose-1-phosphate uridylyltransferase